MGSKAQLAENGQAQQARLRQKQKPGFAKKPGLCLDDR
jgi:hypothetical protein